VKKHLTLWDGVVFICVESRLITNFSCKFMFRREANNCLRIAVTIDGQTFESPRYFQTVRQAEYDTANLALMSSAQEES
jgi:hypothetical protein